MEQEPFKTAEAVQEWLTKDRNVPVLVAAAVASTLKTSGYEYPSSLLNIPREDLVSLNFSPPHRNILFNKLRQQQQQDDAGSPPTKRARLNVKKSLIIDDATQEIRTNLQNGMVNNGGTAVEMQSCATAAQLYLQSHPLHLPMSKEDVDEITAKLASEALNFGDFCRNCNIMINVSDNEKEIPSALIEFLSYMEHSFSWTGEAEDEIHSFVETAITGPIRKIFGDVFRVARNKSTKTSSSRADYSISSDDFQLFRGEDKMRARVKQENPAKELLDKSPKGQQWDILYGPDVPYIFGYYSIGGAQNLLLQFACIPKNGTSLVLLTSKPFDLTKFSGLFGCRLFVLALMPHLIAIKRNIKSTIGLDWHIIRELDHPIWDSTAIHIGLDHTHGDCCLVKDLFYDLSNTAQNAAEVVSFWKNLSMPESNYLVKIRRIDHQENFPEEGTGRVRRTFVPLCQPDPMTGAFPDGRSAKIAVLHVTKALQVLHANGLVHNDVRWSNVVRKQGEETFVLVDYDDMREVDEDGNVPSIGWMDPASHAPDILSYHNKTVDLWGLCKMMSELVCDAGDVTGLVNFGKQCLHHYPKSVMAESFVSTIENLCTCT